MLAALSENRTAADVASQLDQAQMNAIMSIQ